MSRIRDGNDIKPPRNLIDLIIKAKEAQMRGEDRNSRVYSAGSPIIEADSVRRAQRALSEQRVQDTLLAEAASFAPMIEKFRGGKAEQNSSSLAALLEIPEASVRTEIKPLFEMGFLEEVGVGGTFKVPMLYRDGLEITQGKAFPAESSDEEETE
jgi:hypothetical protein